MTEPTAASAPVQNSWPSDDYYGRKDAACPNKAQHQRGPSDATEWHAWAKAMGRTHKQRKCSGCGFWWIWEPRNPSSPDDEAVA